MTVTQLPTDLLARFRAVDRELVGSAHVDTPAHLDNLTDDIKRRGILVPLELGFNDRFGCHDGNHRIAVAIRLGLELVPVSLKWVPIEARPGHAQPMSSDDLAHLETAMQPPPD
jgi:ParB-like chromosome segregation protein Spo0J